MSKPSGRRQDKEAGHKRTDTQGGTGKSPVTGLWSTADCINSKENSAVAHKVDKLLLVKLCGGSKPQVYFDCVPWRKAKLQLKE